MPTFETLEPIVVNMEFAVGNVRVAASDRTDTVVEIGPSNANDESDVQAVQQIKVDYAGGILSITGPKRVFDFSRKSRSVEVTVELPSGSELGAHLQMGEIRTAGRLGECRIRTTGKIRLEHTGPLRLHTGMGHVVADVITGSADISTANGKIQVGRVEGTADLKSSNGEISVDEVAGDVRVRTANGPIAVGRAGAGVDVKTSNGDIRLGEVVRGAVAFGSAAGDVEIGIAEGTAAWLELSTGYGQVRNTMEHATRPDEADETVEVRGRTSYGDITVHRS